MMISRDLELAKFNKELFSKSIEISLTITVDHLTACMYGDITTHKLVRIIIILTNNAK